jgi:type II restriction/modification system DNA methylase subunit YeeA
MTDNTSSTTPVPNFYRASAADFKKIPGSPIAYWASNQVRDIFNNNPQLGKLAKIGQGLKTGDNERFLRLWHETNIKNISFLCESRACSEAENKKWYPYSNGGSFRKWYGNFEDIVNWENDGKEIRNFYDADGKIRSRLQNMSYYFKQGLTWSALTSKTLSVRFVPDSFIYGGAGYGIFETDYEYEYVLGLLNSKIPNVVVKCLSETMNFEVGIIERIPLALEDANKIIDIAKKNISTTKSDWDSYETSWDFTTLPLLQPEYHQPTLRETYTKLRAHWKEMTLEMQRLEEENNRIFIEAYGLQDELTPEVPLSEITLTCNPHYRYNGNRSEEELNALLLTDTIKEFISYAVGCMFGRYSLDKPGLVLANQGEKIGYYLEQVAEPSFMPDADNIIPILEDEYFEDDIVGRFKEFLKVTFGEDTLSENLDFIAEALGSNGKKSSEAVIRDYFLRSFYKDHVKMYKKRPIYWLFSSGKGRAFNALIYMHRYNKETLALMRTDYLLELEGKLDAKREMIKSDIGKDAQEKARLGKMIDEIMKYDELLKNKADEYIEIDLDDGVKVNYAKFEGLVEKI